MAGEWKVHRVEDIAAAMGDAPFGSLLKNDDYTDSGVLVVQGKNIQGRTCDWSDRRYVSHEKYEKLQRSHCFIGDLLFPKVGTIGKVGRLTACPGVQEYVLSTNTMRFRPDESVATADYVYYFFSWSETVNLIHALNSKSVQPVFNFTGLKNFQIALPPLAEQNAIAAVLGALDDKIESNRRTSRTLEAVAQAIFRAWFVDFEPVKAKAAGTHSFPSMPQGIFDALPTRLVESGLGLVPEGWELLPLDEAMQVNPSRRIAKGSVAPYLDMSQMPTDGHAPTSWGEREAGSGARFMNGDTLVARITPCLENGKTAFVDFLSEGQVGWGSTEYIVLRPRPPIPDLYAYLLARTPEFRAFAIQNMTGTSGRQRVPFNTMSKFNVALGPVLVMEAFGEVVEPLFSRSSASVLESRALAALRDYLLPKLLSGEVRVRER